MKQAPFLEAFGPSPPQSRSSGVTQGGRSHRGPVGLSGQGPVLDHSEGADSREPLRPDPGPSRRWGASHCPSGAR